MSKIPATDIDQGGLKLNLSQVLNPLGGGTSPMSMSDAVTNNSIQPISSGGVFNALKVNTETCVPNSAVVDSTSAFSIHSVGNLVVANIAVLFKSDYPLSGTEATLIASQLPLPLVRTYSILQFQVDTTRSVAITVEYNGYLYVYPFGQLNLPKGTWCTGQVVYVRASS